MAVRVIQYATPIHFGAGALGSLPGVVADGGALRLLLMSDAGVARAGIVEHAREKLAAFQPTVFLDVPPHASEATVHAACAVYALGGCDGIVALGGGSVIDAAKAVALHVASPGPLARFAAGRETAPYPARLPPMFAVPTTAGTGSEISRGLAVTAGDERLVLLSPRLLPTAAIYDPCLTVSMPAILTAATAIDALAHCIEGYLSPSAAPPYDVVALDGARRLFNSLPRLLENTGSVELRGEVMLGAMQGGMAMPLGLGAAHALGVPLDSVGLHHGTVIAALMPPVLRFYAGHMGGKEGRLKEALSLHPETDLATAFEDLVRQAGLPLALPRDLIGPDVEKDAVRAALSSYYHQCCPRAPSAADYHGLLRKALGTASAREPVHETS